MKVNIHINYPSDIEELQRRAADLLASILIKKLEVEEINELIKILRDDFNKITW